MVLILMFYIRARFPLESFQLVFPRSGRSQLVLVALLLLTLPLLLTFRNCVSDAAERNHQLTEHHTNRWLRNQNSPGF